MACIQIGIGIAAQYLATAVVNDVLAVAGFSAGILLGIFALGVLTQRVGQPAALGGIDRRSAGADLCEILHARRLHVVRGDRSDGHVCGRHAGFLRVAQGSEGRGQVPHRWNRDGMIQLPDERALAPGRQTTMCSVPQRRFLLAIAIILLTGSRPATSEEPPRRLPRVDPSAAGMSAERLGEIDNVVREALEQGRMPGCVVSVGRHGKLVYLRAFGYRQTTPSRVEMTTDTVFDLASLTKPIATATSVMQLVQDGKIDLDERVATYLPEFGNHGKEEITVCQLLTHLGGLTPDNALADYADGPAKAWERICGLELRAKPGTEFIYSDVGFIVLGELVRRVSGEGLDQFAQQRIFQPLGDDRDHVSAERMRCALRGGDRAARRPLDAGEVHDPRAYLLGGVAGHAGLFSTAEDLALFAQMLLDRGTGNGAQVLAPHTVEVMTADYPVPTGVRGLGWDKRTGYSTNRGTGFSSRAFGHGGFTGTTLWIDPARDLFVIFLSNRVHPDGQGSVNPLAGQIGTIAAAAIVTAATTETVPVAPAEGQVLCGIDVLQRDNFRLLAGKRVGLITNHTGVNRDGVTTTRLLFTAPQVKLKALFSPEHGIQGTLDVPTDRR